MSKTEALWEEQNKKGLEIDELTSLLIKKDENFLERYIDNLNDEARIEDLERKEINQFLDAFTKASLKHLDVEIPDNIDKEFIEKQKDNTELWMEIIEKTNKEDIPTIIKFFPEELLEKIIKNKMPYKSEKIDNGLTLLKSQI